MTLLVVGSVAYDSVQTPQGAREDSLGGSATYFSIASSYFSPVSLVAIVGEDALNERDQQMLKFADIFEDRYLRQSRDEDRSIVATLDLAWELLASIDTKYLVRLDQKWIDKYHPTEKKS